MPSYCRGGDWCRYLFYWSQFWHCIRGCLKPASRTLLGGDSLHFWYQRIVYVLVQSCVPKRLHCCTQPMPCSRTPVPSLQNWNPIWVWGGRTKLRTTQAECTALSLQTWTCTELGWKCCQCWVCCLTHNWTTRIQSVCAGICRILPQACSKSRFRFRLLLELGGCWPEEQHWQSHLLCCPWFESSSLFAQMNVIRLN